MLLLSTVVPLNSHAVDNNEQQRHVLMLEWEDWRDQLPKQLLPEPCTNQAPWWRQFEEMMLTAFKEQLLTFCGVEWDTRWQVRAK